MGFDSGSGTSPNLAGIQDSLMADGRVLAPGAGGAIATLAAPPAGIYEVEVNAVAGAGAVAADNGNIELRFGATIIGSVNGPITGIRRTLDGATAISLNATGAATAGVEYSGSIVATRIA